MAEKTFALMGPGQGPKVPMSADARLVVKGLQDGETLQVTAYPHYSDEVVTECKNDGEYALIYGGFVSCFYSGVNHGLTCFVLGS